LLLSPAILPPSLRVQQQLTAHLPTVSCPSQLSGLTSLALTSRHCRVMATPVPESLSQLTALGQLKICHGLTQVRDAVLLVRVAAWPDPAACDSPALPHVWQTVGT
jgi:hypothetical protein